MDVSYNKLFKLLIDKGWKKTEFAKEVGISPNHFSSLFHKTVGVSFRDYLSQVRVEESKRLLLYTDYSLADIAASMGFPDQSNFSKVFKRFTGMSPGRYRG